MDNDPISDIDKTLKELKEIEDILNEKIQICKHSIEDLQTLKKRLTGNQILEGESLIPSLTKLP